MGCDIHAVIEYAENGFYNFFAAIGIEFLSGTGIDRDYALFARLGYNRRGAHGEPRFPLRGLSPDISEEMREIFYVPNNFYFTFVKIEPESVDEKLLKDILQKEYGNSTLSYYEENNIAPVLAFTHSVRLDKVLDESTDFARLEAEAELRGVSSHELLERWQFPNQTQILGSRSAGDSYQGLIKTWKFPADDEITKLQIIFKDWQLSQFTRTDLINFPLEAELINFLEFYGDWAFKEYETTGLVPNDNWHSPSWLNFNELKEVLSAYYENYPEFLAEETYLERAFWAMQELGVKYGNENVRLVFWFDN